MTAFTSIRLIKPSEVAATSRKQQGKLDVPAAAVDVINKEPESKDPKQRAKRNAKNNRYDRNDAHAKRLPDLASGGGAIRGNEQQPPPPVPVKQSDAIVICRVTRAQPYLTSSETGMYTEVDVAVEQLLKNNEVPSAVVGGILTVDREAGAIRLPDRRVIRYETGGMGGVPRNGHRYLLFLKRVHNGADLAIVTGYELRAGKVFPLDAATQVFDPATGMITRKAPFDGVDETSFLAVLQNALASPERTLMPEWRLKK